MDSLKEIFDQGLYNQPDDLQTSGNVFKQDKDWHELFLEGVKHQKEKNFDLAEQSVSRALKVLSALPERSHFRKEKAKCFHVLAELYLGRSSQQKIKEECCEMVVKSIALSEAERIYKHGLYKEDKEIDLFIETAELRLIERTFGTEAVERLTNSKYKTRSNRSRLNEIRSKITNEHFQTLASCPAWDSSGEQERCDAIEKVYQALHADLLNFISEMFLYCSQIAGPAPCDYSVLGLGSTSRKESTPYSDLEFAILLDEVELADDVVESDRRTYFRLLTYFVAVQILKLGETILPSLGIASLNNFYSENKEDDWFYDDMVPKGFSFDGMMPWACKTPLGRKPWRGKPAQEYIMTIDEMLELQDVSDSSSGEMLETANVFSSVCHLFGNEDLTTSYQTKLSTILTDPQHIKIFQHRVLAVVQNLMVTYKFGKLDLTGFGVQQDVKREVYRLASLLVEQISKFFGIFGLSSWQSLKKLLEMEVLTTDCARNLLVALSITTELRLQCYHKHGMQKEMLPTVPQMSIDEKNPATKPHVSTLLRLYKSLLPLQMVIHRALQNQMSPDVESCVRSLLLNQSLYDNSPYARAMAYIRILDLPKALVCLRSIKDNVDDASKAKILLLQAVCYRLVGMFYKVLECCREVQNLYIKAPQSVDSNDRLNALMSMMHAYMELGLYQEALKLHQEVAVNIGAPDFCDEDNIIYFLNSSAVLFMKMEQPGAAENLFKRVMKKFSKPRKNYFAYFSCMNNFAVLLLSENRLTEAKTVLENALLVAKELYGDHAIHPSVACCLTNLGKVYYGLQETEKCDHLLQMALIIYKRVHGPEQIDPKTVDALVTKARAYQFAGKWNEMHSTLIEAKEIAFTLYADQPHAIVALVHFLLGHCEYLRGRFSTALNHYKDSLKIFEDCGKEIGERTGHDCDRATILLVMASLGKICSLDDAYLLSLNKTALEIEEAAHGKGSCHPHLALCYSKIGCNLIQKTYGERGQEFLDKAIQIFEEMKLENTYNYGQCRFTFGTVLCDVSPEKAEEHLKVAETVLKKILRDENHYIFLAINTTFLRIYRKTNRTKGVHLADKVIRHMADKKLSESTQLSLAELYQVYKLADFYQSCGRRNTARALLLGLIRRIEEQADPRVPEDDYLVFLLWITEEAAAMIYESNEMFSEAEAMFQRFSLSTQKSTSKRAFVRDARMKANWHLASIFIQTGRDSEAFEILNSLAALYQTNPKQFVDPVLPALVFWLLGELNRVRVRLDQALSYLQKALKIYEDVQTNVASPIVIVQGHVLHGKIMNTLGLIYEQGNLPTRALEFYKVCLNDVEGKEPSTETATFHQNMADTLKTIERFDDALVHYNKSLEVREMLHSEDPVREDIATVLYHIALTQYTCGRFKEAIGTLDKLLPLRRNLLKKGGELQNYCAAMVLKGNCHIHQADQAQEAKDTYEEVAVCLSKLSEGQPNKDWATVITNIGHACQLLNDWESAVEKFRQALQMKRIIYQEEKSSQEVAEACHLLAGALFERDKFEEALIHHQDALVIHQSLESTSDVIKCLLDIAECYQHLRFYEKAVETFERAEKLCSECDTLEERTILRVHKEIAVFFTNEEVKNCSKSFKHLGKAVAILKRIKQSEKDDEQLEELEARMLSLQFS